MKAVQTSNFKQHRQCSGKISADFSRCALLLNADWLFALACLRQLPGLGVRKNEPYLLQGCQSSLSAILISPFLISPILAIYCHNAVFMSPKLISLISAKNFWWKISPWWYRQYFFGEIYRQIHTAISKNQYRSCQSVTLRHTAS